MQSVISLICLLLIPVASMAQTSETRYYKDEYMINEVPANKAGYSQTVTQNSDGSITTVDKNLKTQKIISSESFKDDEPTGIWIKYWPDKERKLDYNFPLIYSDKACKYRVVGIKDYFENNDTLHYVAPKVAGGDLTQVVLNNVVYPSGAMSEFISGKVMVSFIISADARIENVVVRKGVHVLLDKEAVRVIREIKLLSAPMLNSQPINVCVTKPLGFEVEPQAY